MRQLVIWNIVPIMVRCCCVPGCSNRSDIERHPSFFTLPLKNKSLWWCGFIVLDGKTCLSILTRAFVANTLREQRNVGYSRTSTLRYVFPFSPPQKRRSKESRQRSVPLWNCYTMTFLHVNVCSYEWSSVQECFNANQQQFGWGGTSCSKKTYCSGGSRKF